MTATADFFDYTIVEGDDIEIIWTLTDSETSDPFDFTGVTKMWFTLKKDYSDDDTEAFVSVNTIDDSSYIKFGPGDVGPGQVWVWIQDTESAGLAEYSYVYYDIQVIQNGKIATLVRGRFPFVPEVTEANS